MPKKVMTPGRETLRKYVPDEQHSDVGKGYDAKDGGKSSMSLIQTAVHSHYCPRFERKHKGGAEGEPMLGMPLRCAPGAKLREL